MDTALIIFIVVAAVVVVLGLVLYFVVLPKIRKKLFFTCAKCKTHYDYERDVEWTCVKEFASVSGNEHRNNVEVKFTCHCPKCGEVSTHTHTFITHKWSYGSSPSSKGYDKVYNLEELVKNYYQ